jgi:hypothetical protein
MIQPENVAISAHFRLWSRPNNTSAKFNTSRSIELFEGRKSDGRIDQKYILGGCRLPPKLFSQSPARHPAGAAIRATRQLLLVDSRSVALGPQATSLVRARCPVRRNEEGRSRSRAFVLLSLQITASTVSRSSGSRALMRGSPSITRRESVARPTPIKSAP